ncbi:MAG: TRAP transporter small permease [Rhodospirillales bacterium]|nr:TRAP transporter small permease [Rhodospirillales bacterium]MDH3792657.1 TRAP transporter small permease [Rhodospirillales bacterium]MDH3914088.1 TRAP transporter small permease [Rhodospirillales bacterium]MDH3919551.1 TRAP transporter small permease [Rhodospirillales bacterium]MDH3968595.1 TRAP transporter small permease [Rhodospirillales bacterium]
MNGSKSLWKRLDDNAERWLLLGFYAMIVATIVVEVVRRFVLSYSSIWGEEIARYAFIYLAWVGASAAVKDRAHIRIDVLLHYLSDRGKAVIYLFGDLCMLALALLALYTAIESLEISLKFGSVTHGLRISLAWFLAAVPLGFSLMVYRLGQSIWRDLGDLRRGRPVYEGARMFD